ncbi:MAG: TlpA family protein disulfide reductase [Saprospiraceae bacterium]|nr:TlpA family protein disulfide reductase [Saprospiraceae bacterium]
MSRNTIIIIGLLIVVALAWYQYRKPKFVAGESAPDFNITLADGQSKPFSALRGEYTILQFWGSWCGPCRAENPFLVEMYEKYHSRGLNIVSVGIERSEESWRRAIQNDGMIWPAHTIESGNFDGPLARQFNIHSIPATFLINAQGQIMGVNQRQEHLRKILAEKLGH